MKALLLTTLLATAAPAASTPAPIDLRSETLVVEHAKRRAIFGGGVTATRGALRLECPEVVATYNARSEIREVTCNGPVTATEGDRVMTAQSGVFDNEAGTLTLSGEPTLTEGRRRLVGETLVYEVTPGVARLTRVQGELPAEDAPNLPGSAGRGPLYVTAAEVRHDFEGRQTQFDGGVTATRGDLVLRSPRLLATYDESGELQRATSAGGPVTVRQRERRGQAERAIFTAGARTLVLEGNPHVEEGASSLSGRRITFLLGQDRVEVEQPRAIFPVGTALPGRQP